MDYWRDPYFFLFVAVYFFSENRGEKLIFLQVLIMKTISEMGHWFSIDKGYTDSHPILITPSWTISTILSMGGNVPHFHSGENLNIEILFCLFNCYVFVVFYEPNNKTENVKGVRKMTF